MAKVDSVNDIAPEITKIRRDQHAKIKALVEVNAKNPIIALGLVRDLCKSISAVRKVHFADPINGRVQTEKDPNPRSIVVHTETTDYYFDLRPDPIAPKPTL